MQPMTVAMTAVFIAQIVWREKQIYAREETH